MIANGKNETGTSGRKMDWIATESHLAGLAAGNRAYPYSAAGKFAAAHANTIAGFRALLKRGVFGQFHRLSMNWRSNRDDVR